MAILCVVFAGHYLVLCASWAGIDVIMILIIDPEAKVLGVVSGNERMKG